MKGYWIKRTLSLSPKTDAGIKLLMSISDDLSVRISSEPNIFEYKDGVRR